MINSIKLENAGHTSVRPEIIRAGQISEPNFNYINQVALNSGMGRLAEELSYQKAVSSMEQKKGENALNEANVAAAAAEAEAQGAIQGTQAFLGEIEYLQEQNRQATEQRLSILEQQKSFFDSITTNNILSAYNEEMFAARQADLESNPGGEGHLQRMAKAHDELVKKYLSGSLAPEIKQYLMPKFKEGGAHVANQAFNDEQTRTVARAKLALDGALKTATLHVANGMNPEEAIKELDPIMESIPNSMAWKATAFKEARSELIEYSLKRTAMVNPGLAARNMSMVGGIYGELSPAQRLSIEHTIQAAQADINHKAAKLKDAEITAEIAEHKGEVSECFEGIWSGNFGYADLVGKMAELTNDEYVYLLGEMKAKHKADIQAMKKQIVVEAKAAKDGNYYSFDAGAQNEIWLRKLQTEQFMFRGEPSNDNNRMQAEAVALKEFNKPIPIVTRDLKVRMLEGTAEQATDAVLAFRELYATNRIILGGDHAAGDHEVLAMLKFSTAMEDGATISAAQHLAKGILSPVSNEERSKFRKVFNEDFKYEKVENALKKLNIKFDDEDYISKRFAENFAQTYFLATRGDMDLAVKMTAATIQTSYGPSTVNGPDAKNYSMWRNPDKLFAGKGYDGELVRKAFCNRAMELAAESKDSLEGWVEILPVDEGQPNKCKVHTPTGIRKPGTFWFEAISGRVNQYRVKYSTSKWFGNYSRDIGSGFRITKKNSAGVDEAIIVDIDDLDWNDRYSGLIAEGGE